jgi:hypothetical protein
MPRRRISSLLTFVYKFIFPIFFTVGGAIFFRDILRGVLSFPSFPFVFAGLVYALMLPILMWQFVKLKKVDIDGDYLYVSNYRKEITIPLSDVYDVSEMRWMDPFWITIYLHRPSEFGERIVFIPPYRQWAFASKNPLVDELKQLVESKRTSRFIPPLPEKRLFR